MKETITLKVRYDEYGESYVLYKNEKIYVYADEKDYGKLQKIETICAPIETFIVFEIVDK